MSATVLQPDSDPRAEMQQFFENSQPSPELVSDATGGPVTSTASEPASIAEPVPAAATTTTAAATATPTTPTPTPSTDYWSEVATDEDLPPSLKGRTRKEVWDALKPALAQAHTAGFEKNRAVAELEVERLVNKRLNEERQQFLRPQQHQQQQSPTQQQRPYEQLIGQGVDPQVLFNNPGGVLDQIPRYVQDQVNLATQNLQQQFQQQIARTSGETLAVRADLAQNEARDVLKIDKETFTQIRPWLATIMANNQADPTVPTNWVIAANLYKQNAAKLFPTSQPVIPTPAPAGNTRPAATAAPTAARRTDTTGSRHMDTALKPHLETWNADRTRRGLQPYTLAQFKDYMYSADDPTGMGDGNGQL